MQLWNDYEGKTIAEKYELGPLLGPEGRSALFSLKDSAAGTIAITESLNDEEQMVACWAKVAAVKHENLVELREFGKSELDGAPLTYVVMETSDGSLADLLKERAGTYEETKQIAASLSAALLALHESGIAHGNVIAENVVAVGETVKLRTDCIRDCGTETTPSAWQERTRKDVQDLSLLLLRVLTLEKRLSPETKLAGPFDRMVEKGYNGTWGLEEIHAAVVPAAVIPAAAIPAAIPAPVTTSAPVAPPVQYTLPEMEPEEVEMPMRRIETPVAPPAFTLPFGLDLKMAGAGALGLVLLLALSVHFFRSKPASVANVQDPPAATAPAVVVAPPPAPKPVTQETSTRSAIAGRMQAGWYVIAYTYNREDQAWKKVASIMKQHPSLEAKVVDPGGHGPFLVALGGPMTRDGAASARSKALREGMPRDTFVRNYVGS